MSHLNGRNLIASLFEQFADCRTGVAVFNDGPLPPDVGVYFELSISLTNHGYERDGNTHHPEWERRFNKIIHIIILSHHRVYVMWSDSGSLRDLNPTAFKNTSNHDSCWRTDGLNIIDHTIAEAHEHCYAWMPEEHSRSFNEVQQHMFNRLGRGLLNTEPMTFVQVERARIEGDSYRDQLVSIKELKFTLNVTE